MDCTARKHKNPPAPWRTLAPCPVPGDRREPIALARLLTLAAVWGASFLFMRIIAPELGTVPTAFFRVSIACLGLIGIVAVARVRWDFQGKLVPAWCWA